MRVASFWAMIKNRWRRNEVYCKAEYWDAKAAELEGDAVSMWPNNHLNALYHRELFDALDRLLPELAGKRVLDVGCGTGRVSRYLAAHDAQVTGIDFSEKTLELARVRSPKFNPEYRAVSFYDLDERACYDVAVTVASLTVACRDAVELREVLRRIGRALAPGGAVLFVEPIHHGFLHRVLNLSLEEFRQALQAEGFRVDHVDQLHFWPCRLLLAYLRWPAWITVPLYHLGQGCMKRLLGGRFLGDYKAVLAAPDARKGVPQ